MKRLDQSTKFKDQALSLKNPWFWWGPCVALYLDDLEAISLVMQKLGDVTIRDEDYQYDSFEEMREKCGNSPSSIFIGNEHVKLTISKNQYSGVNLQSDDSSDAVRLAFVEIVNLLQRTKRRWIHAVVDEALGNLIVCGMLIVGSVYLWLGYRYAAILNIAMSALFIIQARASSYTIHGKYYAIRLQRRHQSGLAKYRDRLIEKVFDLIAPTLWAIVGYALNDLVQYLRG